MSDKGVYRTALAIQGLKKEEKGKWFVCVFDNLFD